MEKTIGQKTIMKIAKEENLSVEEIRKEIQLAIDTGMASDDPIAKANWAKMCRNGNSPTPEDIITYFAKKFQEEM